MMVLVGRKLSQSTAFSYSFQHICSRYVEQIAGISCEIYTFQRKFLFPSFQHSVFRRILFCNLLPLFGLRK